MHPYHLGANWLMLLSDKWCSVRQMQYYGTCDWQIS